MAGDAKRISPCTMCTCTKEGPVCQSLKIENCFHLAQAFSQQDILKDHVCKVSSSASMLYRHTVKKRLSIFASPAAMSLINLSLAGNTVIKLFPLRESLVSVIPAGDKKIINLFYSVSVKYRKYVSENGRHPLTAFFLPLLQTKILSLSLLNFSAI